METTQIKVLAAIRINSILRFREGLSKDARLKSSIVTSEAQALEHLQDPNKPVDVFVVDNSLGNVYELIKELRQQYPRLLILLVDEDADFGMPGRADDVTTDPFYEDDLVKKIKRLAEERRLETLRADALPPVRTFAKSLRKASKGLSKLQSACTAVQELGYDYVAYYNVNQTTPPSLTLGAQVGAPHICNLAPTQFEYGNNLVGWVAEHGQAKMARKNDEPAFILVERDFFSFAIGVPVGNNIRFGVMVVCREQPSATMPESVMMIELIGAQLAAALAKEQRT